MASVYDESVCWDAPVSKYALTDTIYWMQSNKQAYNKKKGILVIYVYLGGVEATIR